jgi:tetratricopeptide (TPR) repeat protein
LLLLVDDLQWASRPTLAVLDHIVSAHPRFPALIAATSRDDVASSAPRARFGRPDATTPVRHIAVGGLEPDDVYAMVAELHGDGARPSQPLRALAEEIHAESSGNPLFVTSLAQSLDATDRAPTRATAQPLRPPERVMELVRGRLATLDARTVDVLQKAAVSGTEFEFSLLRIVTDTESEQLLDTLAAAVDARYLVELPGTPLRYRFPHAVVRSALLETVPVSQRMRLHRLAGYGLEQLGRAADDRTLAALAHHFSEAAALGEGERAVNYCRLAADVATQQLAHVDAVAWYEQALDVANREGIAEAERFELLLALGRAQVCAGDEASRTSLFRAYELALDAGDVTQAAEALLSLNRGFFSRTGETDHDAVAGLETLLQRFDAGDVVDDVTDADAGTAAVLRAALASELVWSDDGERRFALSDEAVAAARQANDPRALARVLGLRNMTILAPDTLRERTANCHELLGLAEEIQDDLIRFDAAFHRGGTALEAGDAEAAHDMVEAASRVADTLRQPRLLWRARMMQTAQSVFRGALADAERFADEALEHGTRAGQGIDAFLFHTEQRLEIRRWQGRLDEDLGQLRPFAGRAGADFACTITRYLYEAGDVDDALRVYRAFVAQSFLPLRRDMLVAPTLYNLAFLAARSGDVATAEGLYDALVPFADSFANTTIAKPVGWHFLGMLRAVMGKVDEAESSLRRAIAVHDLVGAPLFRAESEIELARVLLESGRTGEAEALLAGARATAEPRGAGLLVRECGALAG